MCVRHKLGTIPHSPLAGSLLAGKSRRDEPLPESVRANGNAEGRFADRNWEIIETLLAVGCGPQP